LSIDIEYSKLEKPENIIINDKVLILKKKMQKTPDLAIDNSFLLKVLSKTFHHVVFMCLKKMKKWLKNQSCEKIYNFFINNSAT